MKRVTRNCRQGSPVSAAHWMKHGLCPVWALGALVIGWSALFVSLAGASHQGHERHADAESYETTGSGHPIPGASFQVFLRQVKAKEEGEGFDQSQAESAVQTVIDAFTFMLQHRTDYPRFDESLKKDALKQVVIEPHVLNDEGKEFPFLVARTKEPGRVTLLINSSTLKDNGYLNHPDKLVPLLAREFQWVVSKADTAPKTKAVSVERQLKEAPIRPDQEILALSGDDRVHILHALFDSYLRTVDDQKSLEGQSYYEVDTTRLVPPSQPDSTLKLYEIRVREALQKIVREPYFAEKTPKAVRSLLNGKVWNVSFVKVDQRDWATRTRVLPEDKSVLVGERDQRIQPASILVNAYRTAAPDDPFYADTKGLPMGALSADQLARVIASEIQHNILEKSMSGHVAQDALTAPK
ncbi:MAG: hypothetical protein HY348_03385 [Nitrospira defluvii]|nr:hypothetical protein [Nitrospira defluvii]